MVLDKTNNEEKEVKKQLVTLIGVVVVLYVVDSFIFKGKYTDKLQEAVDDVIAALKGLVK